VQRHLPLLSVFGDLIACTFLQNKQQVCQHQVMLAAWLQAFNLINLIIDRLGVSIRPYAPGLLQLLPAVWERAEGQSLLRIQVGPCRQEHRGLPWGSCCLMAGSTWLAAWRGPGRVTCTAMFAQRQVWDVGVCY
jgi:hypothetical protein